MTESVKFGKQCAQWRSQLKSVWMTCGGESGWGLENSVLVKIMEESQRVMLGSDDNREVEEVEGDGDGPEDDGWDVENQALAAVYDTL